MSKIRIFSLGGLNENGKNLYVVEVDKKIFVFDAGLKYDNDNNLGIDYIIPNYDYLIKNKKNIVGIFLSHGHESHIGAVPDILRNIPGLNVYGTKLTLEILKRDMTDEEIKKSNLIEIKPHVKINFGRLSIFPISVTHSIPDAVLYVLYTKDGAIVYTGDYVFDGAATGIYKTDIGKLAYVGKQGVLCLLSESIYAEREGHTSPNNRASSFIREVLQKSEDRIIATVFPAHFYRIQEIFDEALKTHRKVVIMGKPLQETINYASENGYITVEKSIIGDLNNLNDKNALILISDAKEKPFANLVRIIKGFDKYIKIKENDTIFITEPTYDGIEKITAEVMDEVAMLGADAVILSNKKHLLHHASQEDLMLMLNLMNPKYYFPIRGEYKNQVQNANIASLAGIPSENILLKENGDVVTIENGILKDTFEKVPSGSILIDGNSSDDIGEVVLKDREMLSDNGIMIISVTLNKQTKEIISGPEVLTRGFVYVRDSYELINEIKKISEDIIIKNTKSVKYIEYNKVKNIIRDELSKYLIKETGNKPMIITVMQEI